MTTLTGERTAIVVPAQPAGARKSWRRMVTAIEPVGTDAFALAGPWLDADIAYDVPDGALILSCDVFDGHREISLWRVTDDALNPVKTWTSKKPLGRAVLNYTGRRITVTAGTPQRLENREPRVNAYPGRCGKCRRHVEAGAGLLLDIGGSWSTEHVSCPPPPRFITPNRYSNTCFACGSWVAAGEGVAIRLDQPAAGTGSWYWPMHPGQCPADGVPGPANRVPGWCADCGEQVRPGGGYWLYEALHHRGPCPRSTTTGPTWLVRRRFWIGGFAAGQTRRVQVDLRRGGPDVPACAPGLRVLSAGYVEFVATVMDTADYSGGGQRARVRPATAAEAEDVLAAEAAERADTVRASGFKARFGVERPLVSASERLLRMRILGLSEHVNPWMAEITGRDPDFRWDRRFLRPDRDWSNATRGGRGVEFYWTLTCGRVYQAQWRADRKRTVRAYLRATPDGDVVQITAEEVEAWLNTAPSWPAN